MKPSHKQFETIACKRRLDILSAILSAGKGHIGGAYSVIDILIYLFYSGFLKLSPENQTDIGRDRLILGKGHSAVALYSVLSDLNFFDSSALQQLNKINGFLGEHPDQFIPGNEFLTGSLGHGLGVGTGMALAAKKRDINYKTIVILGDGECYEGSIWEAAQYASHLKLTNLVAIVDRNGCCVQDRIVNLNNQEPFADKWQAFGWEVLTLDGHDYQQLAQIPDKFSQLKAKPLVIIANTIKGKGVSFMEDKVAWHHGGIDQENYKLAAKELQQKLRECADG